MHWLIVEDALRDRQGHWLEWVSTFQRGFTELGDQVTVLADAQAEPDVCTCLNAQPVLPRSIWHRLGDGAGLSTRYSRVFTHNWHTWRIMSRYLCRHESFDAIFVPTVSVHHLLAWSRLIKHQLNRQPTRVLLFFLTAPLRVGHDGTAVSDGSPTARLLFRLIRGLETEVRAGKVVLGVETEAMRQGLEAVTGIPFVFFPQPVRSVDDRDAASGRNRTGLRMACYGAARAEKGSDVLQEAILLHRQRFPKSRTKFFVQWIEDFTVNGLPVRKHAELLKDPQVNFLTRYFAEREYAAHLRETDVMLLPYRLGSYALRGSRVVIEAAAAGIPVIATRGTTLARLAREYGAGLWCDNGSIESLAEAIQEMEDRFEELSAQAQVRRSVARQRFSVATFHRLFRGSTSGVTSPAGVRTPRTLSFQES